jgi:hypothetical protein
MPAHALSDDMLQQAVEAVKKHGNVTAAAVALGISRPTFQHRYMEAQRRGMAAPDGFKIKGTSTLYNTQTGEPMLQWVKTTEDQARKEALFQEAAKAFAENLPRLPAVRAPKQTAVNLLSAYNISDHHFGMLAWDQEVGADYDLSIAERLLMQAMQHLVSVTPACQTALIAIHGDLLHYDSYEAVTPASRHLLDSDSRYPKMVRVALRCIRAVIGLALERHTYIRVIVAPGNHDPSSSVFLRECLAALYEKETRVSVDTSPTHFHYFEFGLNLIGVHHGDTVKMAQLPLVMAADRPEAWGRAKYRYWWTGHVHHDSAKDFNGCRVESFRVLAPADAYATKAGYRSMRDMKAIILHHQFGEVARHIVNPQMLGNA